MRRSDRGDGLWMLFVAGLIAGAAVTRACETCEADAQDAPHVTGGGLSVRDRDDVARCLVAEADGHEDEMYAILGVVERRSALHRMSWGATVRGYCAVFRVGKSPLIASSYTSRRAHWIIALPEHGGPWTRHWPVALRAIDEWRAGNVIDPCPEPAMEWGDRREDSARARERGWHEVMCGSRLNAFFIAAARAIRADVARGRGGRR